MISFDENTKIPSPDSPVEDRLLFLQENMVNFVKQYNLPVIEVSLVVSKYIRTLLESLNNMDLRPFNNIYFVVVFR